MTDTGTRYTEWEYRPSCCHRDFFKNTAYKTASCLLPGKSKAAWHQASTNRGKVTMKQGEHTLVQQIGSKGYYGKVRLGVESVDPVCISVDFDAMCGQDWRIGTTLRIVYAWDLYRRSHTDTNGLDVRVLEITGKPADSTNLVVAFVAANALWKALEWTPPKPPVFDPKQGVSRSQNTDGCSVTCCSLPLLLTLLESHPLRRCKEKQWPPGGRQNFLQPICSISNFATPPGPRQLPVQFLSG